MHRKYKKNNYKFIRNDGLLWMPQFGIARTSTNPSKVYFKFVLNRKVDTFIPFIINICQPNIVIIAYQWRGFQFIFYKIMNT